MRSVLARVFLAGAALAAVGGCASSVGKGMPPPFAVRGPVVAVLPVEGAGGRAGAALAEALARHLAAREMPARALAQGDGRNPMIVGRVDTEEERGSVVWLTLNWQVQGGHGVTLSDYRHEAVVSKDYWQWSQRQAMDLIAAEAVSGLADPARRALLAVMTAEEAEMLAEQPPVPEERRPLAVPAGRRQQAPESATSVAREPPLNEPEKGLGKTIEIAAVPPPAAVEPPRVPAPEPAPEPRAAPVAVPPPAVVASSEPPPVAPLAAAQPPLPQAAPSAEPPPMMPPEPAAVYQPPTPAFPSPAPLPPLVPVAPAPAPIYAQAPPPVYAQPSTAAAVPFTYQQPPVPAVPAPPSASAQSPAAAVARSTFLRPPPFTAAAPPPVYAQPAAPVLMAPPPAPVYAPPYAAMGPYPQAPAAPGAMPGYYGWPPQIYIITPAPYPWSQMGAAPGWPQMGYLAPVPPQPYGAPVAPMAPPAPGAQAPYPYPPVTAEPVAPIAPPVAEQPLIAPPARRPAPASEAPGPASGLWGQPASEPEKPEPKPSRAEGARAAPRTSPAAPAPSAGAAPAGRASAPAAAPTPAAPAPATPAPAAAARPAPVQRETAALPARPAATPTGLGVPIFTVKPVQGAPGDGNQVLTEVMRAALKTNALEVSDDPRVATHVLQGIVKMEPPFAGRQKTRIIWMLTTAGGEDVGSAVQENTVKEGSLNGAWGQTAYVVTAAAVDGIQKLLPAPAGRFTGAGTSSLPPPRPR